MHGAKNVNTLPDFKNKLDRLFSLGRHSASSGLYDFLISSTSMLGNSWHARAVAIVPCQLATHANRECRNIVIIRRVGVSCRDVLIARFN